MSIIRQVQKFPSGSYAITIPKTITELQNIKQGDKFTFELLNKKIIMSPVVTNPVKITTTGQATTQINEVVANE